MKYLKALAALLAMCLALVGCSNNTTPATGGSAAPGGSSDVKVAIILKTLTSEFWQNMKAGAEAEAEKLGIQLDVYASNSEDDVEGQVALLENALGQGYTAIGVAPISNVNMNNVIARATKDGVYIVNIDEPIDMANLKALGGTAQAFVTTDNVEVGGLAGQYIVDQLKSGGQVAIIEGKAGVASGEARKEGATKAFEAASGVEIVESLPADWDRTKAFDVANNYINKYPDLKGIYCANDTMAMGAQEAVERSGKAILVVGTDGNSDAIESVKAGKLAATVKQDSAAVGAKSVELLNKLATDKPTIDVNAEPEQVRVPAVLITKDQG